MINSDKKIKYNRVVLCCDVLHKYSRDQNGFHFTPTSTIARHQTRFRSLFIIILFLGVMGDQGGGAGNSNGKAKLQITILVLVHI